MELRIASAALTIFIGCQSPQSTPDAGHNVGSPQLPNPLVVQQIVGTTLQYGSSDVDAGNSGGGTVNINWLQGQDQQILLTGSPTFTFTAPLGVSTRILRLIQDGAGSHAVTWPGSVKWPGGTPPTLTTAAGGVDIVSCYFNGATYDCQAALNFQ